MQKSNGTAKTILALVAAIGIPGVGVAGFYKLQADTDWHGRNIEALRVRHEADIASCETKFNALKGALDGISTRGASSDAKLDMLVQMVRDMKRTHE
jgi:hypothetical protein